MSVESDEPQFELVVDGTTVPIEDEESSGPREEEE